MVEKGAAKGLRSRVRELEKSLEKREEEIERLRASEIRYRTLIENAPVGIWHAEPNGGGGFINSRLAQISGLAPEAARGQGWVSALHPEDRDRVLSSWKRFVEGTETFHSTYRFLLPGGEVHWVVGQAIPVYEPSGSLLGHIGTLTDITDLRRVQESLLSSEARLNAILLASPNPIAVCDINGNVQYLNPCFTDVFGWSLDELKGDRLPYVPDNQVELTSSWFQKLRESGTPVGFETQRKTRDGRILDELVSAALIQEKGEPSGIVISLTDLSERKEIEARSQAVQRLESLGTLSGGIAHDFNNLLMGIQGNTSLMLLGKPTSHPDYEKLKSIEQHVQTGADLTRQLLGFAKGGKCQVEPTNLNVSVRKNSEMFGRTRKDVTLNHKFEQGIWTVEVDRAQMDQVLMNLYVNAWQAMPGPGAIYIETSNVVLDEHFVRPFGIKPGEYVKLSICDTGVGMNEATKQRIFDPFFTTRELGRGTGLGLASVYGIVRNHSGLINVISEVGRGTTFEIFLPRSRKAVVQEERFAEKIIPGKGTILLVDDEEMITSVGQKLLESLGYEVVVASSGTEALRIYSDQNYQIDLVILDVIMPSMDGGEIFDRLRNLDPNVRVLLSSGYSIDGKASQLLRRGCNGFIQKPFSLSALSRKLREILGDTSSHSSDAAGD